MDIAPLGFAVETAGLERGKKAAQEMAAAAGGVADAVDKATRATIAEARAFADSARQSAAVAAAKLQLLRSSEGVSRKAIEEAAALARSTKAAADAAEAKYKLAAAGEDAEQALQGVSRASGALPAVLQGVTREAAAMATQMGIGGAAGRLGMAGAMGAAQGAASRLAPQLTSLTGITSKLAVGVGATAAAYVALAATLADNQDRWASYQQQLVNTLGSQGVAQQSLYAVVDIANEVGVGVDAALQSFNRFARAKEEIGATNEELLLMTETIMKLGRASGVEAGAMQGAMMQLSQALASGRLNGDELRSIMENMQPLAKAIAEGLGVGIGELRKMGAEGELTGEKVFRALLSQSAKANDEFAKMPKTVEQSRTRLANAFDELGAHIGKAIGASTVMRGILDMMHTPVDALNRAFRGAADDGMDYAETRLQQLEERLDKITKRQTAPLNEARKQFDKEEFKREELEKQIKEFERQRAEISKALPDARDAHYARALVVTRYKEEIDRALQAAARGKGFEAGALESLERLGVKDFQEAEKRLADLTKASEQWDRAIAGAKRQLEALRDPFQKLVQDADNYEKALASGSGGMVDMFVQALPLAEQTGRAVTDIVNQLMRLERLRAEREVRGMENSATTQARLAAELAGGGNRITAEAAAEAADWAFQKFGDTVDQNRDIVNRYTEALIALKRATEALGDATEITRLKNQIEELNAVLGVLDGGGGGYQERLAKFNTQIEQFRRERSSMPSAAATPAFYGTPSSAALPTDLIAFFTGKGAPLHVAQGIAAGIMSESSNNGAAINPTSGAVGLGQWLGSRKSGLFQRFGKGGVSRQEQLEYLWWELNGGDFGGPSVLASPDAATAATRYIGDFMRPGKDTASGTARALRYLGVSGGGLGVAATDLSEDVLRFRRELFEKQEAERARRTIESMEMGTDQNVERLMALRGTHPGLPGQSGPEAIRAFELELKVAEAIKDVAPEYREQAEAAIRRADAVDRILQAELKIDGMRRANDQNERRNAAARTGDPAVMRQLELELEIEEIRRTQPADKQAAMIGEATRRSEIERDGALARATGQLENQKRLMADQFELLGKFGDEARLHNALLQARNDLFQMGIDLSSQQAQAYINQTVELERQAIVLDRLRQLQDNAKQTAEDIGQAFRDFLSAAARDGELNWKTAIRGIEEAFYDMLDRVMQQFVISPLVQVLTQALNMGLNALFGGMSGGLSGKAAYNATVGLPGWANGGVFAGGEPTPFAHGNIFNAPTRFLFGGGRSGLAGEGPGVYEALMPLKRGPDGGLGVVAQGGGGGGGTQVTIIDQRGANAEPVEVEERQAGDGMRQIKVMIRDAVKSNARAGALDADMRGAYGISRQSTRR